MKKLLILIIFLCSFSVLKVNAESQKLYDVLKNSSVSDSGINFNIPSSNMPGESINTNGKGIYMINDTKNNEYPIIYFRGNIDNNFVVLNNNCFQIIRSTTKGGLYLLYAGVSTNGKCSADKSTYHVLKSKFGKANEELYLGYTYLENGERHDSVIKEQVDLWFENNFSAFENQLEDAVFCNDIEKDETNTYVARYRLNTGGTGPSINCKKEYSYTVDNPDGNGYLKYPVALISADELTYAGGKLKTENSTEHENLPFIYTGVSYWAMTPYVSWKIMYPNTKGTINENTILYSAGVRPYLAVKNSTLINSGNGTVNNPYILTTFPSYDVTSLSEEITLENSKYEEGELVKFKTQDKEGLTIDEIIITDKNGNRLNYEFDLPDNNFSFKMPNKDINIKVTYREKLEDYNVYTENDEVAIKREVVERNQKVKFAIDPKIGYEVDTITILNKDTNELMDIAIVKEGDYYTFEMPANDVLIKVSFSEIKDIINPDTGVNTIKRVAIFINIIMFSLILFIFINTKRFI